MTNRKICISLFFCLFLLGLVPDAKATPYFDLDSVSLYTEHNLTFTPNWSYQFGAIVSDDGQDNIASVIAEEVNTKQVFTLSESVSISGEWQWYSVGVGDTPFIDQLKITATNIKGEKASILTHVLENETPFDFVTNITVSDTSLTPTFTWQAVDGAESYQMRIEDSNGYRFFDSEQIPGLNSVISYTIPVGTLTIGEFYTARIIANDYDLGGNLENRSSSYFDFQTSSAPVPEPATMILFGTGLVGLLGTRLRKKK